MSLLKAMKSMLGKADAPADPGTKAAANKEANPAAPGASTAPPTASAPQQNGRLLCLNDDAAALPGFEQAMSGMRAHWDVAFAPDAAVAMTSTEPFEMVVCNSAANGSNWTDFLVDYGKRFPGSLRFLRCAAHEPPSNKLNSVGTRRLNSELNAEGVAEALNRAFRLQQWMNPDEHGALIARIKRLPSLPAVLNQVLTELAKPEASVQFVGRLVSKEPALTAKILQWVNSSGFGLQRHIDDPVEAVLHLGADRTKSLILAASVFLQFDKGECPGFSHEKLWQHSMGVGGFARTLMNVETHDAKEADLAFTAGLLHDTGKLLLAANLPDGYSKILDQAGRRRVPERVVEREALGTTHAELGAWFLGTWGLPLPILEAIAWHHRPADSGERAFSLLTAVHVAEAIDNEKRAGPADAHVSLMDANYIAQIGMGGSQNRWREVCGCAPKAQDERDRLRREAKSN